MGSSIRHHPRGLLGIAGDRRHSQSHVRGRPELHQVAPEGCAVETAAFEIANHFQDEVYQTVVAAIARHPDDFAAAMRESLRTFLVDLRRERLAYVDLLTGDRCRQRRLEPSLRLLREHKRHRLVELWARYYERANGLGRRDAEGLSSFQYHALRGLVAKVDGGQLGAEEAITFFIEVVAAAIARLGGTTQRNVRARSEEVKPCGVRR